MQQKFVPSSKCPKKNKKLIQGIRKNSNSSFPPDPLRPVQPRDATSCQVTTPRVLGLSHGGGSGLFHAVIPHFQTKIGKRHVVNDFYQKVMAFHLFFFFFTKEINQSIRALHLWKLVKAVSEQFGQCNFQKLFF